MILGLILIFCIFKFFINGVNKFEKRSNHATQLFMHLPVSMKPKEIKQLP